MQQGRDPAVEVLQLRRELKHLKSRYKALEGAFLALRQQGNGSHARMEAFLFRLRPARAQLEPPRSSFRKWVCRLLCLPELPEEERIWNNEGAWLLGVETERRGNNILASYTPAPELGRSPTTPPPSRSLWTRLLFC